MVPYEADDALASAAAKAALDDRVTQVLVCTPDKDLAQCVVGNRVVQLDRRRGILRDEAGVLEKWGVRPESIPDYLAVVGDSADGFPGLPGGAQRLRRLPFPGFLTLRMWRRTGASGIHRSAAPNGCLKSFSSDTTMRFYTGLWQR